MKNYFFCIALYMIHWGMGMAQSQPLKGYYLERSYTEEYQIHEQTFCMSLHASNCILFGNSAGLTVFNGSTWKTFPISDITCVFSVLPLPNGRIFVGGYNSFGYMDPDANGNLVYHSLKKYISKQTYIGRIHSMYAIKNAIYLVGEKGIVRWNNQQCMIWETPRIRSSNLIGNRLFLYTDTQVLEWHDGQPTPLLSEDLYCRNIFPYGHNQFLLFSFQKGIFLYKAQKITPLTSPTQALLQEKKILQVLHLRNGNYAIATQTGGVVVIDTLGNLREQYTAKDGYNNKSIISLTEDKQGGLWILSQEAITYIDRCSGIEYFDTRNQLSTNIINIATNATNFYILSDNQVMTTASPHPLQPYTHFIPVTPSSLSVNNICMNGQNLFIATKDREHGLLIYQNGALLPQQISPMAYVASLDSNTFISTFHEKPNLYVWTRTATGWKKQLVPISNTEGIAYFGHIYQNTFLLIQTNDTAYIVQFPFKENGYDIAHPKLTLIRPNTVMPAIYNTLRWTVWKNQIFYNNKRFICSFNFQTGMFEKHKSFYKQFPGLENEKLNVIDNFQEKFSDTLILQKVFQKGQNAQTNEWIAIVQTPKGTQQIIPVQPYISPSLNDIMGKGYIWSRYKKGMRKIPIRLQQSPAFQFPVVITQVLVQTDSVISTSTLATSRQAPKLTHDFQQLRFEFGAVNHIYPEHTFYQYKLEGYQPNWSDWTQEQHKEYTSLPPGTYTFHVRAKNALNHYSTETTYLFHIATPWYATYWMYLLYIVIGGVLLYAAFQIRYYRLTREKQKLEAVVHERTLALEEKNEQLKEADRLKSNFFANLSHEFRTPLTLILAPLEKQLTKAQTPADRQDFQIMTQSAFRLKNLINQLLDLSKIEAQKMTIFYQKGDFQHFLQALIQSFTLLATQRNQQFTYQIPPDPIPAVFDAEKTEMILSNLLSNAFKYTPNEGSIRLIATVLDTHTSTPWIQLDIQDTGNGIAPEMIEHLFTRFYKIENVSFQHYESSGIGLSLTKELVTLLHGTIDVRSEVGQGSCFQVKLPLFIAAPAHAYTLLSEKWTPQISTNLWNHTTTSESFITATDPADYLPNTHLPLLLIVEDHPEMGKYLESSLQTEYQILRASNGYEGMELAKEHIPDLILSDLMMPQMDGVTLCTHIKNDTATCHIPFVLLTAKTLVEDRISSINEGADMYLTKPFHLSEVKAVIHNLIVQRKRLQETFERQVLESQSLPFFTIPSTGLSKDQQLLEHIQQLIEIHLSDASLTVDFIAHHLNLGQHTLARKIKALTGYTPNAFVRLYRLQRARQLLTHKTGNIKEIAFQVGIPNLSYFTKCFKETFGILPSELAEA